MESPETRARAMQWSRTILFVTVSSVAFAVLFEWDRYQIVSGPRAQALSVLDMGVLFWLLVAKSLALLSPVLLITGVLVQRGLTRAATVVLLSTSILVFYGMAIDLVSVGFAGYHLWNHLPYIEDMVKYPSQHVWQWVGDGLITEAGLLLLIFAGSGFAVYRAVTWVATRLAHRWEWMCSGRVLLGESVALVLVVLALVPALDKFSDRYLLGRIYASLPLTSDVRLALQAATEEAAAQLRPQRRGAIAANVSGMARHNSSFASRYAAPSQDNPGLQVDLFGFTLPSLGGVTFEDNPLFGRRNPFWAGLFANRDTESSPGAAGISRNVHSGMGAQTTKALVVPPDAESLASSGLEESRPIGSDQEDELLARRIVEDALNPKPADATACVQKSGLPNVILIVFESFRPSALGPDLMKRLDAWSEQGLRLQRHYSGSNCSHLGLFSLLYGRSPLGYHETLDRSVPPQMLESFKRSGYRVSLLTSGEIKGFRRLHDFINEKHCDTIIFEGESTVHGMNDWPESDRRKLDRARSIVNSPGGQPQFVFFYLLSSHYRYAFPAEFDIFKESASFWRFLNPREQIRNYQNRYANACLFLEHEVMKLVKSIDMDRTIVMITGDHGESMGEDGVFTHGTRMSEVQMRTPFAMVGAGIPSRTITTATVHADVLPTMLHTLAQRPVPVAGCHGRDLIAQEAPEDKVVVVPASGRTFDGLIVVRGNQRALYRAGTDPGRPSAVEHVGFLDESGQFELKFGRAE